MGDCGDVKWITTNEAANDVPSKQVVHAKYSFLGEHFRHVTPAALQCSMFCGGRQCKYCNPAHKFKEEEMAIAGLYSSWVTERILATSRPSTEAIRQFDIIKQFQGHGITSIINLQHSGEHTACGFGLEESGFSYLPQEFMDNDIFYYNFGWNDYGVRSLQSILDMVQVMDFAILNGKVAVHCHAGLGRTGVLIACYIIFSQRSTANEAICKVRKSRHRAIQTRGQINCVKDFASYIKPMWIIFSQGDVRITLHHFLKRQRRILHGEEARTLRYIPKIVFIILQRFLQLAGVDYNLQACVKITHYSFMSHCLLKSTIQRESNEDTSNIDSCHSAVNEDLCIHKENTQILTRDISRNEINMQIKANSMPNVAFTPKEGNVLKSVENSLHLLAVTDTKKRGLQEKLLQRYVERADDISLESSFNSIGLGSSLNSSNGYLMMSASYDSGICNRTPSYHLSDTTSLMNSMSNCGLTAGEQVVKHLAFRTSDVHVSNQVDRYKRKLNSGDAAWLELYEETNMGVLSSMLWVWLKHLQSPIVSEEEIVVLQVHIAHPQEAANEVPRHIWKLIEGFLTFLSKIDARFDDTNRTLRRFAVALTGDESIPRIKFYKRKTDNALNGNESHGYIFFKFLLAWFEQLKLA